MKKVLCVIFSLLFILGLSSADVSASRFTPQQVQLMQSNSNLVHGKTLFYPIQYIRQNFIQGQIPNLYYQPLEEINAPSEKGILMMTYLIFEDAQPYIIAKTPAIYMKSIDGIALFGDRILYENNSNQPASMQRQEAIVIEDKVLTSKLKAQGWI